MSVREKQAWLAVVSTFVFWPFYLFTFFSALGSGTLDGWGLLQVFLWTLGAHVIVLLALSILAARLAREDFDTPPDELERLIEGSADKVGLRLLELTVAIVAIASLWLSGLARDSFPDDPAGATAILMANALMIGGMSAGLVREIVLIVRFRRTAAA